MFATMVNKVLSLDGINGGVAKESIIVEFWLSELASNFFCRTVLCIV